MARVDKRRVGAHRARRSGSVLQLLCALALLAAVAIPSAGAINAAAAGSVTDGTALAATRIDPPGGSSTPRHVPGDATSVAAESDAVLVGAVVSDLEFFWSTAFPQLNDERSPLLRGGVIAMDSTAAVGSAPCVARPEFVVGNAFYCPSNDSIVYDSAALMPVLLTHYGIPGLISSVAHEFGHAALARLGRESATDGEESPESSLRGELRSDCTVGAFLRWLLGGAGRAVSLGADSAAAAMYPLIDFGDQVTIARSDPSAHGLGLDRLSAALFGYRSGVGACTNMALTDVVVTLGASAPPDDLASMSAERLADADALAAAAENAIVAFAGPADLPTMPPRPAELTAAAPLGQFALAAVMVRAAAPAYVGGHPGADPPPTRAPVVSADGADGGHDLSDAVTRAPDVCFVGAWAAWTMQHATPGALGSWPSDAEEALASIRWRPDTTLVDLAAFHDGFRDGRTLCGGA